MNVSDAGLSLIKQFEGFMPTPYICPAGKNTIGYGHVIGAGEAFPQPLTEDAASALLRTDVDSRYAPKVQGMVTCTLTQSQFDALCSFAYNVGPENLKTSTLLRKLNAGDIAGAADEFPRWNKTNGKVLDGLTRRREAERTMFLQA